MKLGFISALTLIFITLKLCGVIAWTWVWVLSPIWLSIVFFFAVLLIVFVGSLLLSTSGKR